MAVVPRGLGLVAALAVSGTALYFAYGYNKKKALVNFRRGKGLWRIECEYGGRSGNEQQQPGATKESSGICVELREGEDAPIGVEILWHELPLFRKALLRRLSLERPSLFLLPDASSSGPVELLAEGRGGLQVSLKSRLSTGEAEVAQVNAFKTGLSYAAEEQPQELREDATNVGTEASSGTGSDFLGCGDSSDQISVVSSSTHQCTTEEKSEAHSLTVPEASSGEGDCCSEPLLSDAAYSSPSSRTVTLVGCFVRPGSRKTAGKPKKVVRFSPSVAEPSSNNKDYRTRCTEQIAQRAALEVRQKAHDPPANHAVRSLAYVRPRLYSQAAKQPMMYSPYRYRGRSYY